MVENTKGFDKKLMVIVTLLFIIGEMLIASTTHVTDGGSPKRLIVQAISYLLGIGLMFLMNIVNYSDFKKYEKHIYVAGILAMLLVYVPHLGVIQGGARGWINLGFVDFQPVEIAKITFIVTFAAYLERHKDNINTIKDIVKALMYMAPIVILLLLQPDLGGAIVFICIATGMIFLAGINMKMATRIVIFLVLISPIMYNYVLPSVLQEYQMKRIEDFVHFSDSSHDGNEQVNQSIVALASGKIFGKGPFNGSQNRFGFLAVSDSDFIFAVCGEEYGLVGMVVVIFLYFLLLVQLLLISRTAKDFYGSLMVMGVFSMFLYQFLQNVGMALGVAPVTGIPLPFVSYGGSSMLMSMLSLALVQNVAVKRRKINF